MSFHKPAHKNLTHPGACITPTDAPVCDFRYVDHGSVIILTPVTQRASLWISEHEAFEDFARWGRNGVAFSRRDFASVVDAIDEAGLYYAPEGR